MSAPIKLDLDALEAAAEAATPGPEHIYTHPRDSNNCRANEWYHHNLYPQYVLELIRRLRAAEALVAARIDQIPTDAKMVTICTDLVLRHELHEQFDEFSACIKKRCTSGQWTLVAFFPEGTDIQTLDGEQLRTAGLVRVQASERFEQLLQENPLAENQAAKELLAREPRWDGDV